MTSRNAMWAIIALCVGMSGSSAVFGADDAENAFVDWLKADGVVLATVEPGHDRADMAPLKAMVGAARIVSMGEPTHGSREVFQMKHRMFEFLVTEMGFTLFGLEAGYPQCIAINEYVLHGTGDPEAALNGQGFWTWDTEEVLALVHWMRAYNADPAHEPKLKFYGIDMQAYTPAVEVAIPYLAQVDEVQAEALSARLELMKTMRSERRIQELTAEQWADLISATEELTAAIDAQRAALVAASSESEFASARRHAVMAGQFVEMSHVMLEPFPGLQMSELNRLNASIETTAEALAEYLSAHDAAFYSSVEDRLTELQESGLGMVAVYAAEADEAVKAAWDALGRDITSHLTQQYTQFIEKSSQVDFELAIARAEDVTLAATIMRIWAEHNGEMPNVRDRCMAEQVAWVLEQEGPEAKIMLWAHNLHVYHPDMRPGAGPMGSELVRLFGEAHINVGFTFNEGSFQAMHYNPGGADDGKPALREHTVGPAEEGFVGHAFAQAGLPIVVADLRTVEAGSPAHAWLMQELRMRSIGAVYSDAIAGQLAHNLVLPDVYDVMMFIERTTRARPNAILRERYGIEAIEE